MPDISDLGIPDEPLPEIDYDAPEAGAYRPPITPGTYEFLFRLPEQAADQFDVQTIGPDKDNPGKYLRLICSPEVLRDSLGNPVPAREDGSQPRLTYQRFSTYKSSRMTNSMVGDLIRGMNLRVDGPMTPTTIASTLRAADGRQTFTAEVNWRYFCKNCDQTVATNARTKKGETPWPRNGDGNWEAPVACPKCGVKAFGNAEITRVKLPKGARS